MDGALVVAIVAAVFAALAAVFAGWSAWSSHRSAQLAAEAVRLERDRYHNELTPRIQLEHGGAIGGLGEEEAITFTNSGPLRYESVSFLLLQDADDRPIAGLVVGDEVVQEGSIGPMAIAQRRRVPLRRPGPGEGGGTLHLRLMCRNGQETWTIPAEVEIPAVPQVFFAWE
jgi:hypothetical protein